MANKLIRASDARRYILKEDPKLAYCIDEIPGVDAVEVVRCKDCVWCERGKSYLTYCNHPTDGMHDVQDDDFCSYGERKDNDTTKD